ncbi:DUF4030 domain-containing protein [Bacillus sp. CGMCC 1.16607]|uniref:DUF4030 domain-containing protein n=1 Tax=Bacillus sp. CGMCC 1.16607 TaxID=3351842 RepID=UPI00363C1AC3
MKNKLNYPEWKNIRFQKEHKQNVLKAVREGNKIIELKAHRPKTGRRKFAYSTFAAVAIFTLLIVFSNLSLGMAKVTAKIPYLSLFIKQEEYKYAVINLVGDTLMENQFEPHDWDISVPKREIKLELYESSKKDNAKAKGKIHDALMDNNFGKYKIKIQSVKDDRVPMEEPSPEVEKYIQEGMELENKIIEWLKQNNYVMAFPPQARVVDKYIYVAVPKTESKERMAALKKGLEELSKPYGEPFRYRVTRIDMAAREQEQRWGELGLIHIIGGGLMENETFKVKTYSYSFHPLPLQITIKTTVKSTDPEAKELAKRIKDEIMTFIKTDERTKTVRNDPFEITVLGKDKKKIN